MATQGYAYIDDSTGKVPVSLIPTSSTEYDWGGVPSAADFQDALDVGCSTGVTFGDNTSSNAIIIETDKDENGSTITAGTNRAQGILRDVPAGDFTWGVRIHPIRYNSSNVRLRVSATAPSVLVYGAVFVDGDDAATDSWYGINSYFQAPTLHTMYYFFRSSGSNRFDTYQSGYVNFNNSTSWKSIPTKDYFLKRTGTDLELFAANPGGLPSLVFNTTVTAGAGMVGIRSQTLLSETDYFDLCVVKEGILDDLPPYA